MLLWKGCSLLAFTDGREERIGIENALLLSCGCHGSHGGGGLLLKMGRASATRNDEA